MRRLLVWLPEAVAIVALSAVVAISYLDACVMCPQSCSTQSVRLFGRWIELPWHC